MIVPTSSLTLPLISVSSSRVIDVKGNGSVSLISDELRRNAVQENTDWKGIGQVSIPRKTIADVAGKAFLESGIYFSSLRCA